MASLSNVVKVTLGACVVVPGECGVRRKLKKACFYVGIAGKEWALSRDFRDDTDGLGYDRATKARVVQ